MAFPLSAGIGLGAAAVGGIFGAFQTAKANRLERGNTLPLADVNANIANNVALAQQMSNVGLAQEQYDAAVQGQNQNLTAALKASGRTGRNTNVGGILRQANEATLKLNAADAAARQQNQRLLIQQRQVLAGEEQRVWNWNKAQPYLKMSQRIAALRNAGNQNMFGALGAGAAIGMNIDAQNQS